MLRSLLVLLLCASFARGEVLIVGEVKYKPYTLVRLRAQGMDEKCGLLWRVNPSKSVQKASTGRGVLEFVAPPGSYEVEVLAIRTDAQGAVQVEEARTTVVILPPPGPDGSTAPPDGKRDPQNATVKLGCGNSGCTATIVGPRRPDGRWDVLTASHCTSVESCSIKLKDGRSFKVKVSARNKSADLCWMVTDEAVSSMPFAVLASKSPDVGTPIWHMGYGVDKPGNLEQGVVIGVPNGSGQLHMSLSVSSGDSGSGIFRKDTGELVSVVCCTTRTGAKVSMWGGVCTKAAQLRPVPSLDGAQALTWDSAGSDGGSSVVRCVLPALASSFLAMKGGK